MKGVVNKIEEVKYFMKKKNQNKYKPLTYIFRNY